MKTIKFKKCQMCGYVHLTDREKKIIELLPCGSAEVVAKLEINRTQAHVELDRLYRLGVVVKKQKIKNIRLFDINKKYFQMLQNINTLIDNSENKLVN